MPLCAHSLFETCVRKPERVVMHVHEIEQFLKLRLLFLRPLSLWDPVRIRHLIREGTKHHVDSLRHQEDVLDPWQAVAALAGRTCHLPFVQRPQTAHHTEERRCTQTRLEQATRQQLGSGEGLLFPVALAPVTIRADSNI